MFLSGREFLPVQKLDKLALAQCRGTNYLEARNLSRCRILIACRCACPGARALRICLGSRNKSKNRDKQLTHIVRVRCRINFKTVKMYMLYAIESLISSSGRVGLEGSFAVHHLSICSCSCTANVPDSAGKALTIIKEMIFKLFIHIVMLQLDFLLLHASYANL
jgi:hypothetical protein